ncbi:MAG: tetratricopeptide repeat protein [Acidobacteria bacterium]|nr:tetratricopeptide repeat protein [Acidobacteriota bacterium]MDA1234203.1 tetratricopeptide repeat protein [Acidobacteriota bacterium]
MLAALIGISLLFPQLIDSTKTLSKPVPSAAEITSEKRGDIFVARKMYREAVDSYQQALKEFPRDARLYNKLGISFHRQEMFGQARRSYEQASRLDGKYSEAVNNLGTIYFAERRYKRAQRTYEKALKLTPNSAAVHSNLGTALFARRRYKQATASYMKALELDPSVFENGGRGGTTLQDRSVEERGKYYYYLAQAFAENGHYDRSVIYLRRSIEEGYGKAKRADQDPAFKVMYELPEFLAIMNPETAAVR